MEFLDRVRWTSGSPDIRINFYYEYNRNGADMQYRVKVIVEPVRGQSYFGYSIIADISMDNGFKVSQTIKNPSPSQWSSNLEWTSNWYTISNKVTGTTSLAIRMHSNGTRDETYYYSMYVAPAYTNVTKLEVASKTETSITLNWETAHTCNAIRYGIGTGSGEYTQVNDLNTNNGSFTIDNLSVNSNYTIYFMPQRKDSGLWGDGNTNIWKTTQVSTYNYPYSTSIDKFEIESDTLITLFNPLNRQCTINVYGDDNSLINTYTTTNTNINNALGDSTSISKLYDSIPNKNNGSITIVVIYGSSSISTTYQNIYTTNNALCGPIFSDFEYEDTNATTLALTGNSNYQIVGYSNLKATISTQNKATAQKGATMSKYSYNVGTSAPIDIAYSSSTNVNGTINTAPIGALKVYAIDTRGNSTLVQKTPTQVIEYTNIQKGNISVKRQNNVGESITLNFDGTYWNNSFGSVTNSITNVTYKYKKTTDTTWNDGTTTIVPVESSNTYSFSGGIVGDVQGVGFNTAYSYNIEITVYDELSSITFTTTLGSGTPNLAIDENGVAINSQYDTTLDNGLQVTGKIYLNGSEFTGGANIPQQDTAPSNPQEDDLWIDTDEDGYQLQVDSATSTTSTNPIENQAITNYVNNIIKWKLVQEVNGQTVINLPSSWNEIIIVSWMNNDTWKGKTMTIPYGSPSGMTYRLSYYANSGDNINIGYWYNDNKINLGFYQVNNSQGVNMNDCKTKIYYR